MQERENVSMSSEAIRTRYDEAVKDAAETLIGYILEGPTPQLCEMEEVCVDVLIAHGFPGSMYAMVECGGFEAPDDELLNYAARYDPSKITDKQHDNDDLLAQFHELFYANTCDLLEKRGVSMIALRTIQRVCNIYHPNDDTIMYIAEPLVDRLRGLLGQPVDPFAKKPYDISKVGKERNATTLFDGIPVVRHLSDLLN